jgi:hypothetical protein
MEIKKYRGRNKHGFRAALKKVVRLTDFLPLEKADNSLHYTRWSRCES